VKTVDSKEQFDSIVASTTKFVVDFYADWCGPCKALGELLENARSNMLVVKVDCDTMPDLAKEYGVRSIPYMVKIENGSVVANHVGLMGKEELEEFLS